MSEELKDRWFVEETPSPIAGEGYSHVAGPMPLADAQRIGDEKARARPRAVINVWQHPNDLRAALGSRGAHQELKARLDDFIDLYGAQWDDDDLAMMRDVLAALRGVGREGPMIDNKKSCRGDEHVWPMNQYVGSNVNENAKCSP